jgi:hypothetical protein
VQTQYTSVSPNRSLFIIIFGGLLGGAIGFFAGGFVGAATCDWNTKEAGCLEPALYGAIIGNSMLMAFSVQLINWRRSSFRVFLLTLIAVSGIAGAGLIVAFATGLGGFIVAIPIVQLASCIAIHRSAPSSNLA